MRSARVRFRRSLTLLVMTLVMPGSAQLLTGNRTVGRIVLRIWLGLLATVGLLVLAGLAWPGVISELLFSPFALGVLRVTLVACAIGWLVLLIDVWRIGDPLRLRQRQRLAISSLHGVLCLLLPGMLLFAAHLVSVQRSLVVDMFGSGLVSDTEAGRYNVLLLGGDAGAGREGMRPDSITVASVDEETGRTVLFGLPRNLEDVPFPEDTPMHDAFPDGFDCDECYINSLYTWATDHERRFPDDVGDVGAWATKRAVEEITGLKINYYAMVDLRGFQKLVDAVGGVTLAVPERIPIGGVGAPITGWIEPGRRHLDGFETLWFARSRATSDDYARMARQKCVMNAMLTQLSPMKVLTNFQEIADAGRQVVTTDVPAQELNELLDLARTARRLPVRSVSFVPPKIETYDPDYDEIRDMVDTAVERAEKADDADGESGSGPRTKHKRPGQTAPQGRINESNDIASACG
ncbi:MAG: LytR family transcriptional regulator [Propionibacteriales bacterium]|nr:LytR family transcriptional regulator [Propionibacteriales bacterium]